MNDLPLEELVTNITHFFPDCSYWIFDMLNDPLLLLDEFGMILFMNDKARTFYGHSLEEAKQLHIAQLDLKITVSAQYLHTIRKSGDAGYIFLSTHKKKSNELVPIQIHARYITVHDKSIFALVIKDISVEKQLKQEFELISQMQKNMLPANYKNPLIEIRSIYRPYNYVSGDFFDFKWENNHILHGYIFDIMGHGLATAFNMSAIRVLLSQAFGQHIPLNEKLAWFNQQAISFIENDSFVAVLGFSFDFTTKQLTYSMAGINQFLFVNQNQSLVIQEPGIFAGLDKNAIYEQHTMSFFSGDIFYFMTDGLFELLSTPAESCPSGSAASYRWLCKAMRNPVRRDDISALCLYIK
ncbi:PAS domain S-box-containing protein [Propionispira arboris]|uniref:PAS domain S-box-containing protein n=1 Tax=Propionispira arboris TaxID=84035 RepID=A0A1H7ARD7_9FIRM|nr:SpoIIE family protein phosphatase [Propionispira arboris]SEJ68173.1 PAS domain S-box-containing protein [Propionispira arboris]